MQAVEINAGAWYLRALRIDERLSDGPALRQLGVDDPEAFVDRSEREWESETAGRWAVCIPTTGELIAVIGVVGDGGAGQLRGAYREGYAQALAEVSEPVRRFAADALGLRTGDLVTGLP